MIIVLNVTVLGKTDPIGSPQPLSASGSGSGGGGGNPQPAPQVRPHAGFSPEYLTTGLWPTDVLHKPSALQTYQGDSPMHLAAGSWGSLGP